MRIDRRLFLAYVGGTVLTAFAFDDSGNAEAIAVSVPGGTLNVRNVPKFVTALSVPPAMPQSGPSAYSIAVRQHSQQRTGAICRIFSRSIRHCIGPIHPGPATCARRLHVLPAPIPGQSRPSRTSMGWRASRTGAMVIRKRGICRPRQTFRPITRRRERGTIFSEPNREGGAGFWVRRPTDMLTRSGPRRYGSTTTRSASGVSMFMPDRSAFILFAVMLPAIIRRQRAQTPRRSGGL